MRINKDQFSFSKRKNLIFSYKRGYGAIPAYIVNRFQWYFYPKLHYVSKFPIHLDVEISNECNMQCPMCFRTTEFFKKNIEKGFMEFSLFKKVVNEARRYGIYSIRISHRGEAFIHPNVIEFIRYAKRSGIKEVAALSNILALPPLLFEEAMKAGLDWLTISFDGLGPTYEKIRRPAKFKDSYEKVKAYKRIKEKAHSHKPVIKIQSVWPAVRTCAEEFIESFEPYVDGIASNPLIDYLHKDHPQDIEYWENFDCPTPYQRLTILFNGLVPYCHNDEFCTYIIGDIKKDTIRNVWHGPDMTKVRKAHRACQGRTVLSACKHCFLPRKAEPVIEHIGDRKLVVEKYTKRTQKIGA
ncbi:MAG: SPASM domain-containing protein [Candidatus Omnitrophota bacterium]|nr:MAG: SPASM domain-containing protein [Candidatus Omnitrophota bacterium]